MNPVKVYRQVKKQTTTPAEAIFLAYQGIIDFLDKAKNFMQEKDYASCGENIFRARRLLSELTLALNDDVGELADKFRALYNYCYRRTIDANLQKDPEILDEVISLISPLRDAWKKSMNGQSFTDDSDSSDATTVLEEKLV